LDDVSGSYYYVILPLLAFLFKDPFNTPGLSILVGEKVLSKADDSSSGDVNWLFAI